ncbi:hypothetical protein EZV62_021026 [Acer yangbiense]|uniref:NAD-dependent epimerase/dehydratase domain-containing protein n=1 Tax=Acer yangbiense TaxID=1000413 RepID=A0A5C7H4I3_9ROSI|nr:hypothetical protein EZV62_021026 [Acer yangbiense]
MALEKERLCVTGAGGYLASWVVKFLLSKDYFVHGTVREPSDEKNVHLSILEKASENLKLFTADLLDYDSVLSAIVGCTGVFHVASPVPSTTVPNPEAKVKRVIVVSSLAAVVINPNWPEELVLSFENRSNGLDFVIVCPSHILGPLLQSTVNASSSFLVNLLKEGYESMENQPRVIVDVRDVAEAVLLAYEKPEAEGRYLCTAYTMGIRRRVYIPTTTIRKEMALEKERVCVTGAGGYLASWVVKFLLSKGYFVHGTVREPSDEKNAHLPKLEKASENLKLFKADLLDYDSVFSAIVGCTGVFHVASPVPSTTVLPNPEVEVIEPAVKGTFNVMKACHEAKVKRVVVVSSIAAVVMNPNWPEGQVMDETCWSDKEYCRTTKNWYCLSKTEAESEAVEYGKKKSLDVVTVCPSLILGPLLQSTMNASSLLLVNLLKEGYESMENKHRAIVDVRDVAEAVLLAYEKPEAEGRYICTAYTIRVRDLIDKMKSLYPNYNYPKSYTEGGEFTASSEKLQRLGWSYRPLEETLIDSVENYRKAGILN